jgi:hypothetical protein
VMASNQEPPLTRVDQWVSSIVNHLIGIGHESRRDENWAAISQHLI